jgi:hypothetical protein
MDRVVCLETPPMLLWLSDCYPQESGVSERKQRFCLWESSKLEGPRKFLLFVTAPRALKSNLFDNWKQFCGEAAKHVCSKHRSEAKQPVLESQLCYLLALWFWEHCLFHCFTSIIWSSDTNIIYFTTLLIKWPPDTINSKEYIEKWYMFLINSYG